MNKYYLCLTSEGPLRLGDLKPSGDYLGTRDYISGSVMRGALAEWLKAHGYTDRIASLVQQVRFGNFFPTSTKSVGALPFPFTALECKRSGGFRTVSAGDKKGDGHGIRDSLLIALAYAELERRGARFPIPMLLRCPECTGRMERVSGFYVRKPDGWEKVTTPQGVQTKVALSRSRHVAQEGMLYRVVALRPGISFMGWVWTDNQDVLDMLKKAVAHTGIGAHTTRGFGAVRLEEAQHTPFPSIKERVAQFNTVLRQVWSDLANLARQLGGAPPREPQGTYFSVDLLAPAVLRDRLGLPTLKLMLHKDTAWLEPVWWATQPTFVGGFSPAWGLPKPTALGASQGSVYVFHSEATVDALLPWLEALEARGVGERTDEGLGEILICHPFHTEVKPV